MLSEGFLYRRLAPLMPCALPAVVGGSLLLRNKWQVASFRDVFLSAHYWRIFEHVEDPYSFVVDLGGHCGHFVVLCELVLEERFGESHARYLVVEGLLELVNNIRVTLADTGLSNRVQVVHGLAGCRSGSGQLRSSSSNLLEASVLASNGKRRGGEVAYVDLFRHIPDGTMIDILKVDIEGSEYALVDTYLALLKRTRLLAMEVHQADYPAAGLLEKIEAAGLRPCLPHIHKGSNLLVLFKR
jgi:FkbM family methyltransferase